MWSVSSLTFLTGFCLCCHLMLLKHFVCVHIDVIVGFSRPTGKHVCNFSAKVIVVDRPSKRILRPYMTHVRFVLSHGVALTSGDTVYTFAQPC
jgi:hypothetical protein